MVSAIRAQERRAGARLSAAAVFFLNQKVVLQNRGQNLDANSGVECFGL
jgi:hypothetical protein